MKADKLFVAKIIAVILVSKILRLSILERGYGMSKYIIVAESGADIPQAVVDKYDIRIVQMHVEMGDKNYLDHELSIDDLKAYYDKTGKVPKTAGSNPAQYIEIFEAIKQEDPDAIVLHICYTDVLSVCYQSSMIADDGSLKIHHIDSKNVSMGQGMIVEEVAKLIAKNPDINEADLLVQIDDIINSLRFSFIPGDITYLKAGGRVSNAQYLGARLLRVKPLIEVQGGFMNTTGKYFGAKKDIARKALNDFLNKYKIDKSTLAFGYTYAIDDEVKEELIAGAAKIGVTVDTWYKAGAVITSHAGPGGFGILGIEREIE